MRLDQQVWSRVDTVIGEIVDENGIKVSVQPTAPTTDDAVAWATNNPIPTVAGFGVLGLVLYRLLR